MKTDFSPPHTALSRREFMRMLGIASAGGLIVPRVMAATP